MQTELDSYKRFMKKFSIEEDDLIEFGIDETIFIPSDKIDEAWGKLKNRIKQAKEPVFIRGYGRDAKGTVLFEDFYKESMNITIKKDSTNNAEPTKLIRNLTGFSKLKSSEKSKFIPIQNYQISHIFGKTKNIYTFTAPWNIVYMPKILDPFTGHESKGIFKEKFQKKFQEHCFDRFKKYIDEYNDIVAHPDFIKNKQIYMEKLNIEDKFIEKFKERIEKEFSPIIKSDLGKY